MSPDHPDGPRPDEPEPEPEVDVDAAFAEIVAHWSPAEPEADPPPAAPSPVPSAGDPEALRRLFRPAWGDSLDSEATWDDEGHFVPPPPPPLPTVEPRRRLAWGGLFGTPLLALVLIVLGLRVADWILATMVAGFVGGFLYLVATMGPSRGDDRSGGDGAVL